MAEFLSELDARCVDDMVWRLNDTLSYQSDIADRIDVPAGFETDFASVPRIPVVYTLFGDRAHREAVVHDALYRIDSVPVVSRATADRVFLEAMECRGKGAFVRYAMYAGVRLGGWAAYHKRRMADRLSGD